MKKNRKHNFNSDGLIVMIILIIFIALIFAKIYAFIVYATKPIDEIPAWVIWIMMSRGRR